MAQTPARNFHNEHPKSSTGQTQARSRQSFQPLPQPTGKPPYHLSLDEILPAETIQAIKQSGRIIFHIGGDTGGVRAPQPQQIVAMQMENQFNFPNLADRPAFFYHLGDVVYYYGEASEYYPQFYEPYGHYPAPIFAIPGNHDGDVIDPNVPSLDAFARNFCAPQPSLTAEAGDTLRDAMTQPNVYWTLDAPFITIIGLYTNVPEGGRVDDTQTAWLVSELKNAPREKALLLAMHHPLYSGDSHHSGSHTMGQLFDRAIGAAGRVPDIVMSGHVHNYQRFTRTIGGGQVPFIVAGASGYWHLHYMAKGADGNDVKTPHQMSETDVILESYNDDRNGFMRMVVTPRALAGEYFTVPRLHESWRRPAQRADFFTLDLARHRLLK